MSAFSRKRSRVESSPSPRTTPKRAARDLSPADSDGYNSGEEKSERLIGRGKAKLHPQPLLPSPVCPPPSDSREKFFNGHTPVQWGIIIGLHKIDLVYPLVFFNRVFRSYITSVCCRKLSLSETKTFNDVKGLF